MVRLLNNTLALAGAFLAEPSDFLTLLTTFLAGVPMDNLRALAFSLDFKEEDFLRTGGFSIAVLLAFLDLQFTKIEWT